jgi:phthalate 4,5-cis-dihydrodiol dehydrogenase
MSAHMDTKFELAPVRIGVAGLGRAFSLMLPTFLQDRRVVMAGACDPRASARQQFSKDFSAPVYSGIEELAKDPSIDAIYIASPHQFHAEHTRIAAAGGKHILVEKPMALTLSECDEMIDACADAGVYLIVGHCHSFDTPYLKAREIIASGEIGSVKMIQALNYTDYLYRPRRLEELNTEAGGGAVYSQAAHQIDIVRLLAGSRATRVRAALGNWDAARPTEGAYSAMLWFDDGVFASLTYSGYGHFDSDEWCGWTGEMGQVKDSSGYGAARQRLNVVQSPMEEARLKNLGTYGGPNYKPNTGDSTPAQKRHQHFGPILVSCEHGDLRPLPDGIALYSDVRSEHRPLELPTVPRFEVIDELVDAITKNIKPIHDGRWAKATLEICLAMLRSGRDQCDVTLAYQFKLGG